ncbi:hypothetical protein, partial [Streptosporangium carneum]|uniref:hypothetical protein n=1 Tax=Streptosporangium carneum TaxID=47481 RepID=UPI0022F3301C
RAWGAALGQELGFDRVEVEGFTMPFWDRDSLSITMTAPYEMELHGTALGGSGSGSVQSEIVYFRTVDDLVAAEDGSLEGRIAFIDGDIMVRSQVGAGYGPANQRRRIGWQHAGRAGASALVVRSVGSDSHRFPHTGMMSDLDGSWADIPVIAVSNPDADHLRRLHNNGEAISLT